MMKNFDTDFSTGDAGQECPSGRGPDCADTNTELPESEKSQAKVESCSTSCRFGSEVPGGKKGQILSIGSVVLCIILIVLGLTLGE